MHASRREAASLLRWAGRWSTPLGLLLLTAFVGCEPAAPPKWSVSKQATELEDEAARKSIADGLLVTFGTPLAPKLPGASDAELDRLHEGALVYTKRCAQCHGASGDGNGAAAEFLKPRPRDYRLGKFKFTSTPYGEHPRREDLERTLRNGIVGTSMPSFALLPNADLNAVIDYVIYLSQRGETEILAAAYAAAEEEMEFKDVVREVQDSWAASAQEVVRPLTVMPVMSEETIELGRKAFLSEGCSKCHGPDGRGKTQDNVGTDVWGFPTNAADLTSGMLHGGQRPIDVYRRISSGINGTPMPSFRDVFNPEGKDPAMAKDPNTMWHLAHFVLHTANHRRSTLPKVPSVKASPTEKDDASASVDETKSETSGSADESAAGDASAAKEAE